MMDTTHTGVVTFERMETALGTISNEDLVCIYAGMCMCGCAGVEMHDCECARGCTSEVKGPLSSLTKAVCRVKLHRVHRDNQILLVYLAVPAFQLTLSCHSPINGRSQQVDGMAAQELLRGGSDADALHGRLRLRGDTYRDIERSVREKP